VTSFAKKNNFKFIPRIW